jgi:hypothetical protein
MQVGRRGVSRGAARKIALRYRSSASRRVSVSLKSERVVSTCHWHAAHICGTYHVRRNDRGSLSGARAAVGVGARF